MDEKWRLSLWAAAAAKDMEFAATQRSSILPIAKCSAGEAQSKSLSEFFLTSCRAPPVGRARLELFIRERLYFSCLPL